jgi:hypothetical protein
MLSGTDGAVWKHKAGHGLRAGKESSGRTVEMSEQRPEQSQMRQSP